jgi:hypothetical protein
LPITTAVPTARLTAGARPAGQPHPASSSSGEVNSLVELLQIPAHLTARTEATLHVAYERYQAYLSASRKLDSMVADQTWTGKRPSTIQLADLFISKTMFFSFYRRAFSKVSKFPQMVKWLQGGEDAPNDVEVWGYEKGLYNFTDLLEFLEGPQASDESDSDSGEEMGKGKGKGKAKVKGEGGQKRKRDVKGSP